METPRKIKEHIYKNVKLFFEENDRAFWKGLKKTQINGGIYQIFQQEIGSLSMLKNSDAVSVTKENKQYNERGLQKLQRLCCFLFWSVSICFLFII